MSTVETNQKNRFYLRGLLRIKVNQENSNRDPCDISFRINPFIYFKNLISTIIFGAQDRVLWMCPNCGEVKAKEVDLNNLRQIAKEFTETVTNCNALNCQKKKRK